MENIVKILKISNIGLFKNYTNPNNNDFSKNNFMYGENASGKSTLSQLFELFENEKVENIEMKKTIGETGNIEVEIKSKNGDSLKLSNGVITNNSGYKIKVFNSHFISENVYNGSNLEFRRFYGTINENIKNDIVGKLKIKENALKIEIQLIQNEVESIKRNIESYLNLKITDLNRKYNSKLGSSILTLENIFKNVKLKYKYKEKLEIVNKLEEELNVLKENENERINILNEDYNLYSNNNFKEIVEILKTKTEKLEEDFIAVMKERIKKYTEEWLEAGYDFIENNDLKNCPLCDSNLSENNIVENYRKYFKDKSTIIKNQIDKMI